MNLKGLDRSDALLDHPNPEIAKAFDDRIEQQVPESTRQDQQSLRAIQQFLNSTGGDSIGSRSGENGVAVPCGAPEALVAAGVQLATDAALRNRLRRAAPASLQEQSWEKVVTRFETDLVAAAAPPAP